MNVNCQKQVETYFVVALEVCLILYTVSVSLTGVKLIKYCPLKVPASVGFSIASHLMSTRSACITHSLQVRSDFNGQVLDNP